MGLIIGLTFLGVFSVVALVLVAIGSKASEQAKQVHASLDSALATDRQEDRDALINLRKTEQFSAIPWLNKKLDKIELAPRIQSLLYQADLKWSTGGMIAGCGLCFAVPAYLVYLRLDSILMALPVGLLAGLHASFICAL